MGLIHFIYLPFALSLSLSLPFCVWVSFIFSYDTYCIPSSHVIRIRIINNLCSCRFRLCKPSTEPRMNMMCTFFLDDMYIYPTFFLAFQRVISRRGNEEKMSNFHEIKKLYIGCNRLRFCWCSGCCLLSHTHIHQPN